MYHSAYPTLLRMTSTRKLSGFNMQAGAFIEQIVEDERQMEALLEQCSRIMVWLLPLDSSISFYPQKWLLKNNLDVIARVA